MSKVQTVRGFISQRLSAAAEEIFELFERTIAEYEEQLCRSKEENERQKKLLEAVYNPEVRLHGADVQQLVVSKEPPPEQQKGGQGLGQEDSEPPHLKDEQEELWSSQEGEQLQELEEEKPQSSQLHQKQNEENRDSVEGPGPVSDSDPKTEHNSGDTAEPETEVINAHQQTEEAHLGLNPPKKAKKNSCVKLFPCSQCGRQFSWKCNLKTHMRVHTGEKPYICPVCGKTFAQKAGVQRHVRIHTRRKQQSGSLCDKRFSHLNNLQLHMRTHSGQKPFTGNSCNNRFTKQKPQSSHLHQKQSKENSAEPETDVSNAHTQTKKAHFGLNYSKNGTKNSEVQLFHCPLCGKSFGQGNLKRHMRVHTGEKPFSCSVCGKGFGQKVSVQRHLSRHTGEKPHSCSLCDKRFAHIITLKRHVRTHTGEKPFTCSSCSERFTWLYQFKKHRCGGGSSQIDERCSSQEGELPHGQKEAL